MNNPLQPVIACNPDGIPLELRSYRQFVVWRLEPNPDPAKKPLKIPYDPKTGRRARTHNQAGKRYPGPASDTWGSFDEARATYERGGYSGIGFVFTEEDPFIGGDIDDCRNPETGEITEEALAYIDMAGTHTEVSPSGTGVKFIGKGKKIGTTCKSGPHEMYTTGRFFTLTGCHLEGTPTTIEERQEQFATLYHAWFPDKPKPATSPQRLHNTQTASSGTSTSGGLSDQDILSKAFQARNGAKIRALFAGDTSGYASPSDADHALALSLQFYTDSPDQLERLLRISGLQRDKWNDSRGNTTYIRFTVDKAMGSGGAKWSGGKNQPLPTFHTEADEPEEEDAGDQDTQDHQADTPPQPLRASVTQTAGNTFQTMERKLQKMGIDVRPMGLVFQQDTDDEVMEKALSAILYARKNITVMLNFVLGDWYGHLKHCGTPQRRVRHIVSRKFGLQSKEQIDKKIEELSGFARIAREIPQERRPLHPRSAWSFYDKVRRLPEEERDAWLSAPPKKGEQDEIDLLLSERRGVAQAAQAETSQSAATVGMASRRQATPQKSQDPYTPHSVYIIPGVNPISEQPKSDVVSAKLRALMARIQSVSEQSGASVEDLLNACLLLSTPEALLRGVRESASSAANIAVAHALAEETFRPSDTVTPLSDQNANNYQLVGDTDWIPENFRESEGHTDNPVNAEDARIEDITADVENMPVSFPAVPALIATPVPAVVVSVSVPTVEQELIEDLPRRAKAAWRRGELEPAPDLLSRVTGRAIEEVGSVFDDASPIESALLIHYAEKGQTWNATEAAAWLRSAYPSSMAA